MIATIAAFLINKRQRRQRDRRRSEQQVAAQLENSLAVWAHFPEYVFIHLPSRPILDP